MTTWPKIFWLITVVVLLVPACGSTASELGITGKPTVVFIYTDG